MHCRHCPGIGTSCMRSQIDRGRWMTVNATLRTSDGKRDLAQLRALDPMPVLGDVGVVSSILNCILKLTSATPNADICSRCVLRAAELDPRGHKRAVDAHRLLCLAVAILQVYSARRAKSFAAGGAHAPLCLLNFLGSSRTLGVVSRSA